MTIHFAGKRIPIIVQFKRRANTATAWQIIQGMQGQPGPPLLVVAAETTEGARKILQDRGVSLVDGQGNTHIELPGLLIHLESREGRMRTAPRRTPTRLNGKAGMAAQALLLDPGRVWMIQDLAGKAGISVGLAHRVVARLETEGILTTTGTGPRRVRRVSNPTALVDLWSEECEERRTVTLAYRLTQSVQQLVQEVTARLQRSNIAYALTGAAAANRLAPFITSIPVATMWTTAKATPDQLCLTMGADRVTEGHNLILLQEKSDGALAFREEVDGLWLANRFRVYADLRDDPRRGREQADHLRREVIRF